MIKRLWVIIEKLDYHEYFPKILWRWLLKILDKKMGYKDMDYD